MTYNEESQSPCGGRAYPSTREARVYRNLALPVEVFDHIKDTQRAMQQHTRKPLSITDTVSHIVLAHKQCQPNAAYEASRHVPVPLQSRP